MARRLVSPHGTHLSVGVGSVSGEYFWAVCVIVFPLLLPVYLIPSFVVVALEQSSRYFEVAVVTAVAVAVPGIRGLPSRRGPDPSDRPVGSRVRRRSADRLGGHLHPGTPYLERKVSRRAGLRPRPTDPRASRPHELGLAADHPRDTTFAGSGQSWRCGLYRAVRVSSAGYLVGSHHRKK